MKKKPQKQSKLCYQDYHEYAQVVMCRDSGESYQAAIVLAKELHKYKAKIPVKK